MRPLESHFLLQHLELLIGVDIKRSFLEQTFSLLAAMKLFVFLFLCASVGAKIIYEKVDAQINPQFAEVKYNIKDQTKLNVDVHGLSDADDIVVSSKRVFNA